VGSVIIGVTGSGAGGIITVTTGGTIVGGTCVTVTGGGGVVGAFTVLKALLTHVYTLSFCSKLTRQK